MRYVWSITIKLALTTVVLMITMNLFNNYPFPETLALSVLIAGISYLAGDLGILPLTRSNMVATLSDILLSFITIWWIGPYLVRLNIPFSVALFSSILIGIGEWFFHRYMMKSVIPRKDAL